MRQTAIETLIITSEAFNHNHTIPTFYTCDGENVNPPILIENLPSTTKSIAIIVEDTDAPKGVFTHWLVWNIAPTTIINEDTPSVGIEGLNDFGKRVYMGPCPPSGSHRYFSKVYALDTMLDLDLYTKREQLESCMKNHIVAYGELMGIYQRNKQVY